MSLGSLDPLMEGYKQMGEVAGRNAILQAFDSKDLETSIGLVVVVVEAVGRATHIKMGDCSQWLSSCLK
jgi:hypothetical protein